MTLPFDPGYPGTPPTTEAVVSAELEAANARRQELVAQYREQHDARLMEPALDNMFDRMRAQGQVRQNQDGSETVVLYAATGHTSNSGKLYFTRTGSGDETRTVMTFAERPFLSYQTEDWLQRGHSVAYDSGAKHFDAFAGPQFRGGMGLTSGRDTDIWMSNILFGQTESEYLATETAAYQQRMTAREARMAARETAREASQAEIAKTREASLLGRLSLKAYRAQREHNEEYGYDPDRHTLEVPPEPWGDELYLAQTWEHPFPSAVDGAQYQPETATSGERGPLGSALDVAFQTYATHVQRAVRKVSDGHGGTKTEPVGRILTLRVTDATGATVDLDLHHSPDTDASGRPTFFMLTETTQKDGVPQRDACIWDARTAGEPAHLLHGVVDANGEITNIDKVTSADIQAMYAMGQRWLHYLAKGQPVVPAAAGTSTAS